MAPEKKYLTLCPSCDCRYRGSQELEGRRVSCKSCGTRFRVSFQPHSANEQGKHSNGSEEQTDEICTNDSLLVLGKLALKFGLVTREQLQEALDFQRHHEDLGLEIRLGEAMLKKEMISQSQLEFLLSVQEMAETRRLDLRFGELAVANGFAAQEDVDQALEKQKQGFKQTKSVALVGEILVEEKIITPDQRDAILVRQRRLEEEPGVVYEDKTKESAGEEDTVPRAPFDLRVCEDKLEATIFPKRIITAEVTLSEVKKLLEQEGIKYGIVADSVIAKYLKAKPTPKEPLQVAAGKAPRHGRDAEIKYYFDTDPLKIGKVKEGGDIDFKDRGETPQVRQGQLIAEKTTPEYGIPGIDVFGNAIPTQKPKDSLLRCGRGVEKSEDGSKILAAVDGRPEVSADGKLAVLPKLEISGDVGLGTGHIDFAGGIEVSGSVSDGYRVKGGSLSAGEILKAEVDVDGDVVVLGGVNGAYIKTRGSLRARYIHGSEIEALGDVVVEKEIIDCKIESSGACIVKWGKVMSSRVSAKKGIEANQVGSETSNPCHLVVGIDQRVANEIETTKAEIAEKVELQSDLTTLVEELRARERDLHIEIAELAQVQDRATVRQRTLKGRLEELRRSNGAGELEEVESELEDLDAKIAEAEGTLEILFNEQDEATEKIARLQDDIRSHETEVEKLREEIPALTEWTQMEKSMPVVKVAGAIYAGTQIKGSSSSTIVAKDIQSVLIKESIITDPDSTEKWNMVLAPLH